MNQNNEDRQISVFEIDANDGETDVVFFEQAYAYHQQLVAEENRLPPTRNLINRDREGAEERLMPIISMIIADISLASLLSLPPKNSIISDKLQFLMCCWFYLNQKEHTSASTIEGVPYLYDNHVNEPLRSAQREKKVTSVFGFAFRGMLQEHRGYMDEQKGRLMKEKYFINDHLTFTVKYHKDIQTNSARIVGFEFNTFREYVLEVCRIINSI
uniref:Transmembrane 9 superfamily member 8-like n=1 Tax=Tanacetum cinerariifolium TaxID=118510 RepID=A0A6L2NAA9_TANCI|nr:transmembrane 9 superfamily member 8-like [Tanacetum cinerariifolium]